MACERHVVAIRPCDLLLLSIVAIVLPHGKWDYRLFLHIIIDVAYIFAYKVISCKNFIFFLKLHISGIQPKVLCLYNCT